MRTWPADHRINWFIQFIKHLTIVSKNSRDTEGTVWYIDVDTYAP
jgi:hypothetical protein